MIDIEAILFFILFVVLTYFHCMCWKDCKVKKGCTHKHGSFVISKKAKRKNNE